MLQAGGDLKGSREAFEKGLDLIKALAAADPENANLLVDLAISHLKLLGLAEEAKDTTAFQKHAAAARSVVETIEKSGKMKGHAQFAAIKAFVEKLPR